MTSQELAWTAGMLINPTDGVRFRMRAVAKECARTTHADYRSHRSPSGHTVSCRTTDTVMPSPWGEIRNICQLMYPMLKPNSQEYGTVPSGRGTHMRTVRRRARRRSGFTFNHSIFLPYTLDIRDTSVFSRIPVSRIPIVSITLAAWWLPNTSIASAMVFKASSRNLLKYEIR